MLRSLRFRLPALLLSGLVLAAVVTSVIASQLFADHARTQVVAQLKRQAKGISKLYEEEALRTVDERRTAPSFAAPQLEVATGSRIYYVGVPIFPGQKSGLRGLARRFVDWEGLQQGKVEEFSFVPPGEQRTFLAVAQPLILGKQMFGAIVVAQQDTAPISEAFSLMKLLTASFVGGLVIVLALAWYLTRRIVRPVVQLARATDEVAKGHYDVTVPKVPGGGEIDHLAERFGEMARRLGETEAMERNFLMTVTHELRTPLTAIQGHVGALREGLADDPAIRDASLEVVAVEATRLERLVGDVLDLAKLDAHRFTLVDEEVDLAELLESAHGAFGEDARRRGIDYPLALGGRPLVVTDGDRVHQIVLNLVTNAFRWTPDGGRIAVTLAEAPGAGAVEIAVEDTGPGIAPEEQERVFRPFFTRGGGTGLGLAIARELATALGGRLELRSEPGRGSRFSLVLPLRPSRPPGTRATAGTGATGAHPALTPAVIAAAPAVPGPAAPPSAPE